MMGNSIFREKSLKRVSSPEQLNDYIRISGPVGWTVLIAVILLLIGVCVWGFFGHLDTTLHTVAVVKDGTACIYIRETDAGTVRAGQKLTIDGGAYEMSGLSSAPVAADGVLSEYAMHIGAFKEGEWVYSATVSAKIADGVYKATLVTDSVSPLSFVFD